MFVGLDAKSIKAQDFVAVNLFSPGLRAIQRKNAKARGSNIIQCDFKNIKERVGGTLDKVYLDTGKGQSFSMPFDGTKTPAKLQISTAYTSVVGGASPNHIIDISKTNEDDVRALLAKGSDVVQAIEVKACVMTLQGAPSRMSPMKTVSFRPQTLNQSSNYNQEITDMILQLCKERSQSPGKGRAHLISVAADGVGCDAAFIWHTLTEFLQGKIEHVALVDPLHDANNFRYLGIIG